MLYIVSMGRVVVVLVVWMNKRLHYWAGHTLYFMLTFGCINDDDFVIGYSNGLDVWWMYRLVGATKTPHSCG